MSNCGCELDCKAYASINELRNGGIPVAAFANVDLKTQQQALVRASRIADTFLRNRYALPMRCPIDPALVQWVVWIAVYQIMSFRGFNPNQGIDSIVMLNYQEALKALTRVANGQQQLCVRQAEPPSLQPQVGTNESRGFGGPGGVDVPYTGPNTWGN